MVGVAQAVERLTVDQVVVGSNPITHPISHGNIEDGAKEFLGCRIGYAQPKRVKYGLRVIWYSSVNKYPPYASVVQLDRAIDFGSISWGFESLRAHVSDAPLAQLAEHLTLNQAVEGSIPSRRTKLRYGRVLELVDKIDLGSIGVIPREGSSPFSPIIPGTHANRRFT